MVPPLLVFSPGGRHVGHPAYRRTHASAHDVSSPHLNSVSRVSAAVVPAMRPITELKDLFI